MAVFETIVRELTKLKAITRPRSQDAIDFKLQLATMARGLIDLPDSAIESGCGAWGEISQWFPTLAEIRAECLKFRPVAPASSVPRLAHEGFSDKRWWHNRCLKYPDDRILWARARELYPSMFYDDGSLVPLAQVNFQAGDRHSVPWQKSAVYQGQDSGCPE